MRYHRLKRSFVIGITSCIILGMLSGCSDKKVDYDSNISQTNADVEEDEEKEKSSSLEQFKQAETWHDDLSLESSEGKKINFGIDANIIVPDADTMSVVEVEQISVDAAFKEKVLSAFFEGTDIYYHDKAHYTKEELEKLIPQQEELVASIRESAEKEAEYGLSDGAGNSAEYLETMEEELQNYQKLLETAKEDYTIVQEFESSNEYLGYRNNIPYIVEFSSNSIITHPLSYNGPEELRKKERSEHFDLWSSELTDEAGENQCIFSMEEAQKMAEQFLNQIGVSDRMCTNAASLEWVAYDEKPEDEEYVDTSVHVTYGYSFKFEIAVAGNPLWEENAITGRGDFGVGTIEIQVTDDGIVDLYLPHLTDITTVTEQVELLPLFTIQEIIRNELLKHTDAYNITKSSHADTLELMYFRVQDENNEGSYSYIPVWRLSDALYSYVPIMVNAIDGSVIYLKNEWEAEDE